jgi:hypothetical protein
MKENDHMMHPGPLKAAIDSSKRNVLMEEFTQYFEEFGTLRKVITSRKYYGEHDDYIDSTKTIILK